MKTRIVRYSKAQGEETITQHELKLRQILDLTPLLVAVFGPDRERLYANQPTLDYLGVNLQEWQGLSDSLQFYHPDDRERLAMEVYTGPEKQVPHQFEARLRKRDGTYRWFLFRDNPVFDEQGRITRWYVSGTDMEDRKRAEDERRESAERFRAIADYTYDWENWIGVDGKLLWVNPAVERITGYSVDECMVMPDFPLPIVAETDREAFARQMREAAGGSSGNDFEFRVRRKDGRPGWVAVSWQPIYDSGGARLGHRSSMRDIEDRKRAEEALRRSETYLIEAQRLTHTGAWAHNATGQNVYWSQELFRVWGFDPQGGVPTREQLVHERIHPEDLEKYWKYWQAVRGPNREREKIHLGLEFRIVLPDGTLKHLHGVAHPILNGNGDITETVGVTTDVTERKRAEDELRMSQAQLVHERDRLTLLLEISDHIARKLDVNELFRAVAHSARKHFGNDVSSFLLMNKQTGCLERKFLDFPASKGFLEKASVVVPSKLLAEWWRLGKPVLYSPPDTDIPSPLREADEAESLFSAISVPLVGAAGPLGLFNILSQKVNAFSEVELGLLAQIGTQISLALDNALAYEGLRTSNDALRSCEAERRRAETALQEMRTELERASRLTTMGALTGSIAHELKQPLAGVVASADAGLSWLAANPPNLSKARRALHRARRNATRAGEVLTRIRRALMRTPPAKSRLSVNSIVDDVLALTAGALRAHDIETAVTLDSGIPSILGDTIQLQQVLLNLVTNAIDAMARVTDGPRTLRIRSFVGDLEGRRAVVVAVSDTGIGFGSTDVERLFDAFHTTKPHGMGIGLWISRSIIEEHGGRLTAQPNAGPGATFMLTIPASP